MRKCRLAGKSFIETTSDGGYGGCDGNDGSVL
jgi:hypothetical protein